MPDITPYLEKFGWPGALLLVIIWGSYKVLIWLGERVVTPITNAHIALVDETKATNKLNADTLAKMTQLLEAKARALDNIVEKQDEVIKLTEETNRILKEK